MSKLLPPHLTSNSTRRRSTANDVVVRSTGGEAVARLVDISVEGAQIICPLDLAVGDAVGIQLTGTEFVPATVRWNRDDRVGLRFTIALSQWELDRIAPLLS